jgi:hypothetical protein
LALYVLTRVALRARENLPSVVVNVLLPFESVLALAAIEFVGGHFCVSKWRTGVSGRARKTPSGTLVAIR